MSAKLKDVIIHGKAMYAKVHTADKNDKYTIDVVVTDEEASRLEELGLVPAKLRDGVTLKSYAEQGHPGKVFRAKTNKFNKKTKQEMAGPRVVDSHKVPMTDLVGNGSTVNVLVSPKPFSVDGNVGVANFLNAVQVVDLVSYGLDFDTIEDGFTAGTVDTDDSVDETDGPF